MNEMHLGNEKAWIDADRRLTKESQQLVDKHWNAIRAVATAVLSKPVIPRPPESFNKWNSPDSHEMWIDGYEIDAILRNFQLSAIVRDESEGKYYAPDLHPRSGE